MAADPSCPVNIPLQSYLIAHCQTGHKVGCANAGFPPFFSDPVHQLSQVRVLFIFISSEL